MADTPQATAPAPSSPAPAVPAASAPRRGFRLGLRFKFTLTLTLFILSILAAASVIIQRQQRSALDREIRERGLALARALSANSVEPLSLGAEATLQIMLLVKDVIQNSDDPEASKKSLYVVESLPRMVWHYVLQFGVETETVNVRNEGVLFARVVDPTGKTLAVADALRPADAWFEDIDKPYQPPAQTQLLSPGEEEKIRESPERNGIYVIAVPIHQRQATAAAEPGGPAGTNSTDEAGRPSGTFLGSVYLGMSLGIVRRALALALSKLILIALGVIVAGILIALWISGRLVAPIHLLRDGALAVGGGKLETQVDIRRSDELGELAGTFNDMTRGLAERELIRGAFGAYVSGDVLNDILANPEAMKTIGGVKRTITMIFTDVRGFTAMAGKLEAEEVVSIINEYLDIQAKLVRKHKGHLDKYVGDAVRAVFGIPSERADDPERALRCAWDIKQEIARLVEERGRRGVPNPKIGIGIDTGEALAGNIGAASAKLEYTVIGDVVTLSEHCQAEARDPDTVGGQIVISAHTYAMVRHLVDVKELPPIEEHGREPLKIYEVTALKGGVPVPAGAG